MVEIFGGGVLHVFFMYSIIINCKCSIGEFSKCSIGGFSAGVNWVLGVFGIHICGGRVGVYDF